MKSFLITLFAALLIAGSLALYRYDSKPEVIEQKPSNEEVVRAYLKLEIQRLLWERDAHLFGDNSEWRRIDKKLTAAKAKLRDYE